MEVLLRPWREEDAASLCKYADDPQVAANLTDIFPSPYHLSDAEEFIRRNMADEEGNTRFCRAISVDGEAAGVIDVEKGTGIRQLCGTLGYWLGRPFWGRGIMTGVLASFCKEAFDRLDIIRIQAEAYARNGASRRVLEKSGFTREGFRRQSCIRNGVILDDCIYGLLKEDLEERTPAELLNDPRR